MHFTWWGAAYACAIQSPRDHPEPVASDSMLEETHSSALSVGDRVAVERQCAGVDGSDGSMTLRVLNIRVSHDDTVDTDGGYVCSWR